MSVAKPGPNLTGSGAGHRSGAGSVQVPVAAAYPGRRMGLGADIVAHNVHETRGQTAMSTGSTRPYAGDITPLEAWKMLSDNPQAVLVDVRTDAEWRFVGVPDLSSLGREVVYIEWNTSDGRRNPEFLNELQDRVPSADAGER